MLKRVRRVLYAVVILAIAFYAWHLFTQQKEEQAMAKYKKDLYISKLNPPQEAKDFTLTSQHGKQVSLSSFRGKKVLLQFMDPRCTDVCPLISQEIIQANQLLGSESKNVVYVAVSVNENHNKVSDLQSFSNQHGLNKLTNWYFLTGSGDQLKRVWNAYGIAVTPSKNGDVQHTSAVYFISPNGKEVYLGQPQNDKTSVQEWADAMSFFIKRMPDAS